MHHEKESVGGKAVRLTAEDSTCTLTRQVALLVYLPAQEAQQTPAFQLAKEPSLTLRKSDNAFFSPAVSASVCRPGAALPIVRWLCSQLYPRVVVPRLYLCTGTA